MLLAPIVAVPHTFVCGRYIRPFMHVDRHTTEAACTCLRVFFDSHLFSPLKEPYRHLFILVFPHLLYTYGQLLF